jgi:hypothetical protein
MNENETTDVTPPEVHEERQAENARDGVVEAHFTELPPRQEREAERLEDERVQEEDQVPGDQPAQAAAPDAGYDLATAISEDDAIPQMYREDPEVQDALTEVGALTKEAGVSAPMARMLTGLYAGLALTEKDNLPNPYDDDAVLGYMAHQYGPKEADAIVKAAQEATAHLGPKFSAWLDRTRLGSHPSMLLLLSAMTPKDGLFRKNTPEQARQAMAQLRKDPKQKWDTPGAKAKWRLLSALANMEDQPKSDIETLRADAKAKKPTPDSATATLDRQLAEFRRNPAYSDRSNPSHKEVFTQYMALMHKRWPGMHNAGGD